MEKRKRKVSANISDEGEEVASHKKLKAKAESIDEKLGLAAEDGDDAEQHEEVKEEEPLVVDNKPFVIKKFREALRTSSFITDVRIFLQKATDDPAIVAQYLKAGGRPLEIAQLLNKVDKSELFHASYVFGAIHLILMEKMNKSVDLTKETDAIELCSYLLNNHRTFIEKLLASNYGTHKKAVLKVLTDAVYLAPHLGRELLTTFNVVFNAETLARFTAHEASESHLPDEERTRTCYIYFILAYIIEGNHILIKNLLDRNELLMAMISGLIYDSAKTVALILNSFLKFVLQAESVSKTKKIQVFNLNVVKELLRLFEWKGSAYFAAMSNKKSKHKIDLEQLVNADEQQIVCDTAHQFLCELLATRKSGIAFKCLGQRKTKFNGVQKKLLLTVDNFWDHPQKADLIIQTLKACPELTKHFIQKHASRLDPFKKNNNWSAMADFFAKLVEEMTPDIIEYQVDKMNAKESTELIKEICMPAEILQQLRSKHTLKNRDISIRMKSTNILYLMFKQCNQYLFNLTKWNVYRTNEVKKIKFEMINHILLLCPSVENILLSLHLTQIDDSIDSLKMFEHLECILDLLLIITKSIPSFIDTTSSVINYIKILGPIYELNREHESSTRIEFKAVKLMLALEPKALSPKTELFAQVIQSFFNVYRFGTPQDQIEAKYLLRNVFHNTSLFENGPLEVDLWLAALNHVDEDSLSTIKDFIVKQINSYDVNDAQIAQVQTTTDGNKGKNLTEMFENIEKGTTIKGVLDVATLRPFFVFIVQSLKELADNEDDDLEEIQKYVEMVGFYLFHYLPIPEAVYYAMEPISHHFSSYMKKWTAQSKPGKLPKEFPSEILNKFYSSLTSDTKQQFANVFESELTVASDDEGDSAVVVNFGGTDYKLSSSLANETQIMTFIYTMMFVTNQLHKNNSLTAEQRTLVVGYFAEFVKILDAISTKNSEIINFGFELNESESNATAKALTYLFKNCFYLLQSFNIWSKDNQITRLVYEMVKSVHHTEHLNEILVHYRKKLSNQISNAVQNLGEGNNQPLESCDDLIDLLTTFRLDVDNCIEIVSSLAQLDYKHFVTRQNETSTFASILGYALQRMAELKQRSLGPSEIGKIAAIYIDLVRKTDVEINYQVIEEALLAYLTIYYHSIADIEDDLFDAIFEAKRLNKPAVKLACLLLDRKSDLVERLPSLLKKNLPKKELIYPLINICAIRNVTLDDKLLSTLYGEYKNGILKTIEKPNKAAVIYRENVLSSIFLIEKCMPIKECTDFLRKAINFESADIYQLQIIKSIHLKILMQSETVETIEQAYENFLHIFIRLFSTLVKHEPLDMQKINAFAYIAYDWSKLKLKLLPEALSSRLKYENIRGTQLWLQFGKSCLKHGLKLQFDSANKAQDGAAILLKLFAYLCNEIYSNGKNDEDVKTFFEMTVTHSNFFDIITLQQQKSALKTNLAYLFYVMVRKNTEVIEPNHLPVLLSGYQGKMSHCDQYILSILQMYEKSGCNTHKYRPFMFGESALSHYSLSSSAIIKPSLLQEPPVMQVLALIDRDVAENTLVNFPVWRCLNVIDQVPNVEFDSHGVTGEEHSNNVSIAKSNIEKIVESGDTKFDAAILNQSARRDETYDDVYDPAFLIPLMQMAFAPETFAKPVRPAQNGLLAVTFACLSSADKEMRLGAAAALQRYRNHLEIARFVDSKLWFHLFDGIKNGISNLTLEAQKQKKSRIPRISYVAGVFFARVINTLVNPLSEIYRPLSTFLLIKNSFNFQSVPEFNVLFHSPDVNHNVHRGFILDVLRDGLKTSSDFNVLVANHIFKALLGFYGSPITTREKNIQVLTVINAAVKIPKSAKLMIDLIGILPWLNTVVDNTEFFQFDYLDILCTILNNLYNSIAANQADYGTNTIQSIETQLMHLLLKICPILSERIAEVSFVRYLNVLKAVILKNNRCKYVSEANLDHLIKCASGYISSDFVWDCSFLKDNLTAYKHCERKYEYNRRLREAGGLTEQHIFILSSLREVIIGVHQLKSLETLE